MNLQASMLRHSEMGSQDENSLPRAKLQIYETIASFGPREVGEGFQFRFKLTFVLNSLFCGLVPPIGALFFKGFQFPHVLEAFVQQIVGVVDEEIRKPVNMNHKIDENTIFLLGFTLRQSKVSQRVSSWGRIASSKLEESARIRFRCLT